MSNLKSQDGIQATEADIVIEYSIHPQTTKKKLNLMMNKDHEAVILKFK